MNTRRDLNSAATRRDILAAAQVLFARDGYAATPLSAIVAAAQVTTGAVYHHFGDKQGLFRAVAEAVEGEILQRIAAASADEADAWGRLVAGTMAMLGICAEPHIQRIAFIDAPNVIGAREWREIELRYAFGVLQQTLRALQAEGAIRPCTVEILAPILLGATIEAAISVARAADQPAALAEASDIIRQLLLSLQC